MAAIKKGEKALKLFRVIFTLCLLGTIIFIFANSKQIGELSGARSESVMNLLNGVLGKLGFSYTLSHGAVRKLAHFAEYALLGFWLMLTLRVYTRRLLSHISWPLFLGLFIPVLDECYQLLIPGRSGQLTDVVIDFAGAIAGICVGLFLLLLSRAFWEELTAANGQQPAK